MIDQNSLRLTAVLITIIAVLFGILSFFRIQYQFYFSEIFLDLKALTIIGLILFFYKGKFVLFTKEQKTLLHWEWRKNLQVFLLPLLLYSLSILVGILFKQVSINKLDNPTTLVLGTVFDIPAIFVFSTTSILIEEIFFRGILLSSFRQKYSIVYSTLTISLLWTIYNTSELFWVEDLNIIKFSVLVLYFFSIGILCSAFAARYISVWPGYSFRIGITSLTPIILTSSLIESDSFVKSDIYFFNSDGIIVSFLLIVSGIVLVKTIKRDLIIGEENSLPRNIS